MPCKHFQSALTDAAASGAPTPELRQHLTTCSSCQAAFLAEQNLFASIDSTLHAQVNAEIPPAFVSRAQARLKDEKPPRPGFAWFPAWTLAAVSAAILLAFVFPLLRSRPRQPTSPAVIALETAPGLAIHQASQPSADQPATTHAARNRIAVTPGEHNAASDIAIPQFAKQQPEVIVPPDERLAFERFVATVEQAHRLPAIPATSAQSAESLQTGVLEIASIYVPPLEPETVLTDFLGRVHPSE